MNKNGDGIDEATKRSKLEVADIMINASGAAFGIQEYLFDLASSSDVSIKNIGFIKGFKKLGFLTSIASLAITTSDVGQHGLNADNGTDAAAGVVGFYPGGWILGPLLSVDKWFTKMYLGPPNTWGRPIYIDSPPNTNKTNNNRL